MKLLLLSIALFGSVLVEGSITNPCAHCAPYCSQYEINRCYGKREAGVHPEASAEGTRDPAADTPYADKIEVAEEFRGLDLSETECKKNRFFGYWQRCFKNKSFWRRCRPDPTCDPKNKNNKHPEASAEGTRDPAADTPFVEKREAEEGGVILGGKCVFNQHTRNYERCPTNLPPHIIGKCQPDPSCGPNVGSKCVCTVTHCERCAIGSYGHLNGCHYDPTCYPENQRVKPHHLDDDVRTGGYCECVGNVCKQCITGIRGGDRCNQVAACPAHRVPVDEGKTECHCTGLNGNVCWRCDIVLEHGREVDRNCRQDETCKHINKRDTDEGERDIIEID